MCSGKDAAGRQPTSAREVAGSGASSGPTRLLGHPAVDCLVPQERKCPVPLAGRFQRRTALPSHTQSSGQSHPASLTKNI